MADKKSWRDYSKTKATEESSNSEKTGSWRDYTSTNTTGSGYTAGGWRDYTSVDTASIIGDNITNRVNNWLKSHNDYVNGYTSRFSGRKFDYSDSFMGDSADWLTKVGQQKDKLGVEAEEILSYLDQHKGYLSDDWMKSVRDTIATVKNQQSLIFSNASKDNEYWSNWGSDEMIEKYGSAEEAYKTHQRYDGYSKKYAGKTYAELSEAAKLLEDGEEKDWLSSYASSVDYDEKSKADTGLIQQEIEDLGNFYDEAYTIDLWYNEYQMGHIPYDAHKMEIHNRLENEFGGDIYQLENAINQKRSYIEDSDRIKELNTWASVSGNEDFASQSGYVSTESNAWHSGLTSELGMGYDDLTYEYINGKDNGMRSAIVGKAVIMQADTEVYPVLEQMSDDEISVYNYYYATEGKEKADEYLGVLNGTLKARKYAETARKAYEYANENWYQGIIGSIASVATSLVSGFEYIGDVIDYGAKKLTGKDAKMDKNELAIITNSTRQGVSDQVDWEINNWDAFDFLYNTTMSGVDSMASMAFGPAAGAVLGLSAAAQGTNDALERGMSSDKAFWNGLFSGAAEMIFESASIGNFKALKEIPAKTAKDVFKNLGKSMLVNASEETLTEISNIAYDTLVNGEFANYTMEELKNGAWKQALQQVVEAGASGALMGVGMGAIANTSGYVKNKKADNAALKKYGDKTDMLIQEGLGGDVNSESYKLAQEYKQQTESGKALTGEQIRNLLAANQDQVTTKVRQKIKETAEKRITELGQTEDASKIAELVVKRVTGQTLSRAEKSLLANSQYGAQVAKEMLPQNITTEDVSKILNEIVKGTENPAVYKSLEARVGTESNLNVSESGKATIRKTGAAVDLSKAEIAAFVRDKKSGKVTDMILNVDGKKVKASAIDYADDSQSYLYEAVSKIENITPADATVLIRDYDPSSGLSVSEYLNGMDEAYSYGYYGYSEADMGAGTFAPKLSKEHAKSAYLLGQTTKKSGNAAKIEAIKRMRTAVEAEAEKAAAEGKEAPKAKEMTITYNAGRGKVVDFDKAGLKLTTKQKAAPAFAQVMHEMGLGTNFELYSSYVNKAGIRVFVDENGVEQKAPSGVYRKADGTIRIDLNAYNGKGLTLDVMAHELTHFIQQWSDTKFQALADFLIETYEKTDMTMHQRVLREQARLEGVRGKAVSYNEAFDEVVANAMSKMLADGKVMERLNELKAKDMDLAQKLWEGLKKLLNKFFRVYSKESALFHDAADLMELKAEFEQMQKMWAEAFVEASENFQASLVEKNSLDNSSVGNENKLTEDHKRGELSDNRRVREGTAEVTGISGTDGGRYSDHLRTAQENKSWGNLSASSRKRIISIVDDHLASSKNYEEIFSLLCSVVNKNPDEITAAQLRKAIRQISERIYSDAITMHAVIFEDRWSVIGDGVSNLRKDILEEFRGESDAGEQYSSQETDLDQNFDYSDLNWATDLGIITTKDKAIFERTINNEIFRGAEPQSANGEYIIDTGKCLMFTDGDFHNPTLSRVIVFATEYESLTADAKEMIFDEAKATGDLQESRSAIERMFGQGFVSIHTQPNGRTYGGQNRGRKGNNRSGTAQKAKSLKERLAEEGLDHLLEEDAEVYASQETDRDYLDAVNSGDMKTAQKMVDEAAQAAGYTVKAYHGTDADAFNVFDKGKFGSATGVNILGDGFYFADSKKTAQQYGKNVYAVYLKQTNPYLATDSDAYRLKSVDIERQGHDGVALPTAKGKVYMVLDPNQIKSAEPVTYDNEGIVIPLSKRFDKVNDDIRYTSQETDVDTSISANDVVAMSNGRLVVNINSNASGLPSNRKWEWPSLVSQMIRKTLAGKAIIAEDGDIITVTRRGANEVGFGTNTIGLKAEAKDTGDYSKVNQKMITAEHAASIIALSRYASWSQNIEDTTDAFKRDGLNYRTVEMLIDGIPHKATVVTALNLDESDTKNYGEKFYDIESIEKQTNLPASYGAPVTGTSPHKIKTADSSSDKLTIAQKQRIVNRKNAAYSTGDADGKSTMAEAFARAKELKSTQETDNISHRDLLANAFEGITRNSIEYKLIQEYKGRIKLLNEQEEKLSKLNAEIRKIRFGTKGKRDTARLTQLEAEAKNTAQVINRHDKKLLSLEASEPLRKVIERERKKEAQKTKDHVKEIQQNKKLRAEQTELRHKIRKAIRDLDKILKHGNKQRNVKEDLQSVVTKALQSADVLFTDNYGTYDMLRNGIETDLSDTEEALVKSCAKMLQDLDKMPADGYENWQARQEAENRLKAKMSGLREVFARERKRLNNTKVSTILGELADAYASLEKSEQSYVQGAYTEAVHNFLKSLQDEVGGTIVKDMTKDQLEAVYTAYKMVLTTVRKANQMFNEGLKMSREQMGNAVIQEIVKAGGDHGLWTKAEIARSQFDWNNTKPIWVADRIGSDTFGKLMQGLFNGQYNFAVDIDEAKQFKLKMDEKYHPRNWDTEKQYEFESSTGSKFSLNLQQILSLYAFSKREQAYSHLLNGGFVFEGNSTFIVDEKGRKKTYIHNGATSYKLNADTFAEIIGTLTAEQKAYADEMQKYLSEVMGTKGNEVSMQLYGIKMFNEQFYFPLRSSGAYMERAKEAEMKKQQGQINLVNSGFTHAVKPEAKNPIILSGFMDVWAEHCNEMSMYHSMVLPMEDFRKVYNYSTVHDEDMESASVYQSIQDAYGKAATDYIDQLYRELNAGATVDPRETPWKNLISKFKKASVMLSASVVVQQFSSIGRAYAVIDPKYFIGAKVNSDTQLPLVEEMKKYAPVAIIKEMGGFDTGTKGSAKSYIMAEQYGKGERIKGLAKDEQYRGDIMGYLPAKADEMTWCAIWEAAKRETKAKHPDMDVKSEEFLKLVGERFSEVIEKTQVYDSVLARSANMRAKGNFMAMATAFMAEPTTTINLLEDAIRRGNKKYMARAFGSVAVSIVLNNALASIVYAMRDDDEDETFLEKYFQSFTSGMIDDINPMTYYPFLKDVYSLFQGYDVERSDMSVIADLRDALKKAVSLFGKDTSNMDDDELTEHWKTVNGALLSILDAGCSVFGVPFKNVRRDVNGIINAWNTLGKDISGESAATWHGFWDKVGSAVKDTIPVYAWTKDEAKTDKLYNAIISGDKAYLGRLKSTYKTDAAYQSAVRKALRENDSRIHDAAQARYDGNIEEYKRIFREIQKEGKFSFNDIMNAVNSEESAIRNGVEPNKATSEYSTGGFVEAVAMGDTKTAQTMRNDIIATHVANGKSQEEAEKAFASAVATSTRDANSAGLLDKAGAENMLKEYARKDEGEAASRVNYWAFCEEHQEYKEIFTETHVAKYREFAEPAGISVAVYAKYINGTKGLSTKYDEWGDVEVTKREQVLEVIDSLDLTWEQKDALYLAAGYSENELWDVPW